MSTAARVNQFADLMNKFFALKPEDFFKSNPSFNDFDGPNIQETAAATARSECIQSLQPAFD